MENETKEKEVSNEQKNENKEIATDEKKEQGTNIEDKNDLKEKNKKIK